MKWYIFPTMGIFFLIAYFIAYKQLLFAVQAIIFIVVILTGIAAIFAVAIGYQYFCKVRAERQAEELKNNIIHSNGDAWIREMIKLPDGTVSIEYARLGGTRLRVNSHDHNPTPAELLYASTMQTTGQTKLISAGQIVPQLPQQLELLPLLDTSERVLIKGASDAGKTTLLQHVAQRSQNVIVLDPHNKPGQWPTGCKVIGDKYNFVEMVKFFDWLNTEIERRYKLRAGGNENYPAITIIIDEYLTANEECDNAKKVLNKAIRECRKIKIRVFIGSHSELVKPLGLQGASDIRDGLVIVRIDFDQITKQRVCKIDYGKGENECYFPPFGEMREPIIIEQLNPDNVFVQLVNDGCSRQQASQQAYGKDYAGTSHVAHCKELLGE